MAARRLEAGQQVLDAVVAEFEASCAHELDMFAHSSKVIGGAAEYCGTHDDLARWTLAYVRDDRAVLPLAVGERDRVVLEYARLDRAGTPIWDNAKFPMPTVIVDGAAYHFAASRGRLLLGEVKLERRAVLLAAIDDMLAVIHVAGRTRSVLHIGKPHSFRELDVDRLLRLQGRARPRPQRDDRSGPVRPPPPIEAEHQRIVFGLAVDVGTGPTIAQVLAACFEDAADRAQALRASSVIKRARGKMWVRPVCRRLYRLAVMGHGNIVGRVGEIIAKIQAYFPDFAITCEAMSDVLNLLHALGTCLVGPRGGGERIWEINLAGLSDPRSSQHRRLCRETEGRHPMDAATMAAIDGTEKSKPKPPTSPTRAAEVEAVRAVVDAAPVFAIDIKAALEILALLPLKAGPDLMASALSKPAAPAQGDEDVAAETIIPTTNPATATAATTDPAATATAPTAAPERSHGDEDATAATPEQAHVGDATTVTGPGRDVVGATLDELRRLPPPAPRTLLLGARVFQKRLEVAAGKEEARRGVATTPLDVSPTLARTFKAPRRRLHLSPDHTLAVAAAVPVGPSAQTREVILGRGRPVGDGPLGARAPPSA